MSTLQITGRHGRSLEDIWPKKVARAYQGMTVEDLPNFAMLYGPNSNLSHNSLILVIEAQARYISVLIDKVVRARLVNRSLALTPDLGRLVAYNDRIQKALNETSFADPRCTSWWKTEDGAIPNNWPGTAVQYQQLLSHVEWNDFEAEGTGTDMIHKDDRTYIGRVVEETRFSLRTLAVVTTGLCMAAATVIAGSSVWI